jgi:hypothetical protein
MIIFIQDFKKWKDKHPKKEENKEEAEAEEASAEVVVVAPVEPVVDPEVIRTNGFLRPNSADLLNTAILDPLRKSILTLFPSRKHPSLINS